MRNGPVPTLNEQLSGTTSVAVGSARFSAGFTLVEILVVASITVIITAFLVANFSRTRVNLNQASLSIQDSVREVQSLALSGAVFQGAFRCGYGIHFMGNGFLLYAGPDSSTINCSSHNFSYDPFDSIVRQESLPDNSLEIVLPAPDIFFLPPNPTTYINNSSAPGVSANILVRRQGASCPGADCRSILVTTSGRIELQ